MKHLISKVVHPLLIRSLFSITNREFMKVRNSAISDTLLQFSEKEAVLYIHFPFCSSICNYCPFRKSMDLTEANHYCNAIIEEIKLLKAQKRIEKTAIKALFFGGGTPSLIPMPTLEKMLLTLQEHFGTIPQITMECNPESLTVANALEYKRLGINRLSIGVQSFHTEILRELGRKVRPIEVKQLISDIVGAGFSNISVDFIYGFSTQDESMLLSDIGEAITLGVEHISLFPLINFNRKKKQELTANHYSHQYNLYKKARYYLQSHGFHAYSVEDFSKSERAKNRYQEAVWAYPQQDLILLGSSAFGMAGDCNYQKTISQKSYREKITKGNLPLKELYVTPEKQLTLRRVLMGLHYNSVDLAQVAREYGTIPKRVKSLLFALERLRLIRREGSTIETTEEGAFVTSLFWAKTMLSRMSN